LSVRNNENRTKSVSSASSAAPIQEAGGGLLSFVNPTELVELPSKGLYYPDNHPLHGVESIEIRQMTTKEEEILTSQTLLKKGVALDRLLQSLMLDKTIEPGTLLVGDKNAMLIQARKTGYGADYKTQVSCPNCNTLETLTYDLNECQIYDGGNSDDTLKELGAMSTDRLTFRVTLPITKVEAEVRLMYGYDEMEIVKSQKNKVRNKDLNSAITDNLKRVVVALNGIEDRNQIETFLEKMPASDARFLRKAVAQLTPTTKMLLDFDCSSCSHNDELEVPITATFFWPDL
jgi:hypothetical protein|tara:strand:+ start:2084 stop:2950 length:867 start_codon:yes stop_codon:yes gene_type:complete